MTATATLLDFVRSPPPLPATARVAAERLLGDTLSVGAAGSTAPGSDEVFAAANGWGSNEEARLIGTPHRLPAAGAAFVNAFRIHCLEWDAVHEAAVVHALSVVTAALSASIDRRGGCNPEEALTALAIGVEVASTLGIAASSSLRFFRPATAGCIGAALAVARLEQVARLDDVLGLATSFCSGTMQAHVEGSIALPLQVANAARSAIMAVDLARAGLGGPHDGLEGPFGYFTLFDTGDFPSAVAKLGAPWKIEQVSTKPYPSGRASHGALGALADLDLDPANVQAIELFAPPLVKRLVGRTMDREMSPAYARLCLPFLAALMLTDRVVDPRRLTAASFGDPALAALAARISITLDGNADPNALSPQRLVVTLRSGLQVECPIFATIGSPEAPLSAIQATAKCNLARALAPAADRRLFDDPLGWFTEPQ